MTEKMTQSMGERLFQLRTQKEMTQEDMAEYLEVSRQSVSKWELNKTLPDVEKLVQLSELYHVSIDYLVKGEEDPEKLQKEESLEQTEKQPFEERPEQTGEKLLEEMYGEQEEPEGTEHYDAKEEDSQRILVQEYNMEYSAKKVIFLLAMIFSGILCISMFFVTAKLLGSHVFSFDNKEHDIVMVDKIYEQYTKAEVWCTNKSGDLSRKTVWLDVPGIREDDFVDYYTEKDEPGALYFEYYGKTMAMPLIIGIILLIFTIVFGMAWRMTFIQWKGKEHERKKE